VEHNAELGSLDVQLTVPVTGNALSEGECAADQQQKKQACFHNMTI
jgi:hypothetical protein